jgi:hypothetical protein
VTLGDVFVTELVVADAVGFDLPGLPRVELRQAWEPRRALLGMGGGR